MGILSRQKGPTDEDKQGQEGGADAAAVGKAPLTLVKQCAERIRKHLKKLGWEKLRLQDVRAILGSELRLLGGTQTVTKQWRV